MLNRYLSWLRIAKGINVESESSVETETLQIEFVKECFLYKW